MRISFWATIRAFSLLAGLAALPASAADMPICGNCHQQAHASTSMTAHGAKNDASGSMCQACHGDASAHVKDPAKNKPANVIKHGTPAEKSAVCMTCHAGSRHLAFWDAGRHRTAVTQPAERHVPRRGVLDIVLLRHDRAARLEHERA